MRDWKVGDKFIYVSSDEPTRAFEIIDKSVGNIGYHNSIKTIVTLRNIVTDDVITWYATWLNDVDVKLAEDSEIFQMILES